VKPTVKTVASQPSWILRNKNIELAVTKLGGQMAPVTFCRNTAKPVSPYYVSPWQDEGLKIDDPVLVPLRGDFFCMPFGANADPVKGEQYFCHGEVATKTWQLRELLSVEKFTGLWLTMKTKTRPGQAHKSIVLVEGENVVYSMHLLEGFSGSMPLGHHATLAMPQTERAMLVTTSDFKLGMTNPTPTENPAGGVYQAFALGGKFTDLKKVPLRFKAEPFGDYSAFPTRKGYDDLLAVHKKPGKTPAWTAAVNTEAGYLWFSMKDPALLPATVFWISNYGNHGAPFSGRNCCLGLEDVCGFFAEGLGPSLKANVVKKAGFPTAIKLSPKSATSVRYIQGATKVPKTFGRVKTVQFAPRKATFVSTEGKKVTVKVQHEFLGGADLE
jgi:hypothetical protein